MNTSEDITIILPNRIGDAILSLPAVLCLKQLLNAYEFPQYQVKLLITNDLVKVIEKLDLFSIDSLNLLNKFKSFFKPASRAFFLDTSSKNLGYQSKKSYGLINDSKKLIKYSINLSYLHFDNIEKVFPEKLINFLKETCSLSTCSIRYFGICLDLGFSVDEIISTFQLNKEYLDYPQEKNISEEVGFPKNYMVFCMEAAYGRKKDSDRRWDEACYFEIAEEVYKQSGLSSVFIGLDNKNPIPVRPYFVDLRKKLIIPQIADLLKLSKGYIGNDTGPLHLANLMQKRSIGIYFRETSIWNYRPIFPELNKMILNPENSQEVIDLLESYF